MNSIRKNITIRNVASAAGVSTAAVSKAINNKNGISETLRQKILIICDELGYQVNSSIQDIVRKGLNGHTRNIAFVLIGVEFADPAYARNMDGIAQAINEFDYNLAMAHLSGKEQSVHQLPPVLRDGRIDGFIISGRLTEELICILKKLNKPYVIVGNYPEKVSGDAVRIETNYKSAMFKMVNELKQTGKKRIAYFTELTDNFFQAELVDSFIRAMKDNQLVPDEQIIYVGTGPLCGALKQLKPIILRQPEMPFDAIICPDFRCASEIAYMMLARNGFDWPSELRIACMRPFPYYKLPVPAIYSETENTQAHTGVKCLVEMIEKGGMGPHKVEITPRISKELCGN
ncbi:MAG: LacI family DNA-binding transcriptional regulator [Victivallaceae bacterium]